jgi:PAS domain S-box-containing protein
MSADPRARERPRLLVYGAAVLATIAGLLLRMALTPLIGNTAVPFITFFPAVLFSAWYGGFRAGALSILLSVLAADYYFVSPVGTFLIPAPGDRITLLIFVLVGFGMALLSHSQRRALERAEQEASRRREAESAERSQRQRLEITLGSIGDAVISTDAEGRVVFANRIALSLLRWPEADVAGKHLDETFRIVNEYSRAKVESPVTKVLREGTIVGMANHTILIARDGTEIPIDDSGAPIRGESGAIEGTVLVFRDVTERRRAEDTSRLLASIVESSDDAIVSIDLNGMVTSWNKGAERTFGYSAGEMIGHPISVVAAPEADGEMPGMLERIKQGELITGYETAQRTKSGNLVNVSLTVSPIRDAMGRIVGASKIARNITESVRAADRLAQLNADLENSNSSLTRSNEALERFAFIASHDLQEPLRMITAYSQLLIKAYPGKFDKDAAMFVGNIVEGTRRMRELLADLLAYTEIGSGPEEPAGAGSVDLDFVIENVRQNLKAAIEENGAVITSDSLPTLAAYQGHFVALFQNLIGNAIKYRSEHPPRIHVSVQSIDGQLRFAVADNGMGIEPEYHEKIFEVFKRLHGKKIPGTGVGLAICQRVVERYGGRIWVQSQVGQGATFLFTLPAIAVRSAGEN